MKNAERKAFVRCNKYYELLIVSILSGLIAYVVYTFYELELVRILWLVLTLFVGTSLPGRVILGYFNKHNTSYSEIFIVLFVPIFCIIFEVSLLAYIVGLALSLFLAIYFLSAPHIYEFKKKLIRNIKKKRTD